MKPLRIHADRLRSLGAPEGASFCVITNARYAPFVEVAGADAYAGTEVVAYDGEISLDELFGRQVPEPAHVLMILPHTLVEAPSDEAVGPRRKLLVMAANSAPTSWEAVEHFVRAGEGTDPAEQEAVSDRFFELVEAADRLAFVDERHGARLEFDHLQDHYHWFEQLGPVPWGAQQVFPAGEISCFLVPPPDSLRNYSYDSLDVTGSLVLEGCPILHTGPPSYLPEDQARLHESLATLGEGGVRAEVEKGVVQRLEPLAESARPAARTLETLFLVDSRYRKIFEIGFSVNREVTLFPGNVAMNEVHGGPHGTVHFGLGMLPHTQYHLDVICPGTSLVTDRGEWVIGAPLAE